MRAIRVISAAFAIIAAGLTGAAFASGYWTGTIADIVVSDPEDGSGTALPDVFCGRSGTVYAAWQQEVMTESGITEFWSSFSHHDFLEYDTYVAFTAGEHEAMHGLTIAVAPPAEPIEGGFGNKRGAGEEDETAIFHVIYGRENLNCRHSLYHRTATVEEENIEWSAAEELINNLHHTDGDLDPAMAIDTEGRMHVAWRGKFEGMNHRECYYTFSTDGGSSWGAKAGTYEMISFDDEYTHFGVKSPAIALDGRGNPCVAWKEIATAPPMYEIHNSKLHAN